MKAHEKVFVNSADLHFYYYRANQIIDGLKPTHEYLDYLLKAYESMEMVPQAYIEQMKSTEILEECLPLTETGTFVNDLERWPAILRPGLLAYERAMMKFIEVTWHKSLVQWAIKR